MPTHRSQEIGQPTPHARRLARPFLALGFVAALSLAAPALARAADFVAPTPEELTMTSVAKYPGVPAVVLFNEEITKDDLHSMQVYRRVKILTDEGKRYANVELGYVSSSGSNWDYGDDKSVESIVGRTIHPDGTIIPFTGKPYLKVIAKTGGFKAQEKVFTLPDVEVGSIIEYRYAIRINDHIYEAPIWRIQEELYVKSAHFAWWPTSNSLTDQEGHIITTISWFPILPPGAKIESHEVPGGMLREAYRTYDLAVQDIPPMVHEEFMPPISSFSYSVRFSYTPYRTQDEYWSNTGKSWSKHVNTFASPNGALTKATQDIIAGAATPDEKLKRIYAAIMKLENTEFTRERDRREDKAAGLRNISNANDILNSGRGTPSELTELFIAMARAAGFPAYAIYVPDRNETLFLPEWRSIDQLRDLLAIVEVDGKEQYFDPGSRYCGFGQLAWQHTLVRGLRQTGNGTTLGNTPGASYKGNKTTRVANLNMNAQGEVTGKVDLTFWGAPALHWRQTALRGDDESLRKQLRETAEEMLPKSLDVEVAEIKDVADYEKPLGVSYKIKGTMGSPTGKRVMLPSDVFLANTSATFPHESRETAVYFKYPQMTQDAVRVNLPQGLAIEAVPAHAKFDLTNIASYAIDVAQGPSNITTRRDFVFGDAFVLSKEYPDLRKFYAQLESKDQESVVLKSASNANAANTGAPASN